MRFVALYYNNLNFAIRLSGSLKVLPNAAMIKKTAGAVMLDGAPNGSAFQPSSNRLTASTCAVCGNILTMPAERRR